MTETDEERPMPKRTAAEYAAMADEFELNPPKADGPVELGAGAFVKPKDGRPVGRREPAGVTPTVSVRFPAKLREQLDKRAVVEHAPAAEVIRRAVAEYLDRHPA